MAGMRHTSKHKHTKQTGFTVIEVVVVMLILAVIAGTVVTAFGPNFIDEQEDAAVRFEMSQIRDAIIEFKQNNPGHVLNATNLCTPADASFLFTSGFSTDTVCEVANDTIDPWNPDYRIGWQGPYMTLTGEQYVDIGANLDHDGDGSPTTGTVIDNILAIADPFIATPSGNFFQWRSIINDTDTDFDQHGRPYLFFDLHDNDTLVISGNAVPRIISMGPNGVYEGPDCDLNETTTTDPDYCVTNLLCSPAPDSDDIVLCFE